MIDLIVLPPPKRTRFTRLREKLQVGEFQTSGFNGELTWRAPPSIELKVRFLDRLSKQIIEPRILPLGDEGNRGMTPALTCTTC